MSRFEEYKSGYDYADDGFKQGAFGRSKPVVRKNARSVCSSLEKVGWRRRYGFTKEAALGFKARVKKFLKGGK